ncbi:hypothetical protein D3C81_1689160 [compost metagenome]
MPPNEIEDAPLSPPAFMATTPNEPSGPRASGMIASGPASAKMPAPLAKANICGLSCTWLENEDRLGES